MQDGSPNAKQQIVDRIKQSTNILITVSNDPSVDALSSALGLSLLLNKLDKHATAVFSGAMPPAMKFLEPNKTFEANVDSLRDFIIALDKEKADRLRYKVEDDVVKIFITPYRTTITDKDLHFSQGDFNVDLIIALGVEKREELDKAIVAHGRILHDATVATINAASQKSSLGSIDWQDGMASSLSEMLVSLSESLGEKLLDQQISTALLTGIVAATERFSNDRTTPRVMTMAAQLMAAGANQQLIANNLHMASRPEPQPEVPPEKPAAKPDGEMHIRHAEKPAKNEEPDIPLATSAASSFDDLKQALEQAAEEKSETQAAPKPETKSAKPAAKTAEEKPDEENEEALNDQPSWMGRTIQPPTLGGTLNATAEEALETKMREETDARNRKLLSHDEAAKKSKKSNHTEDKPDKPEKAEEKPEKKKEPKEETPKAKSEPEPEPREIAPQPPKPEAEPPKPEATGALMDSVSLTTEPTIEQLEKEAKAKSKAAAEKDDETLDEARQAVDAALAAAPFEPAGQPLESIGAQEFTPQEPKTSSGLPGSTQVPTSGTPALPPLPSNAAGDLPSLPPLPPLPDFDSLPPLPGEPEATPPQLPETPPLDQPKAPEPEPPKGPSDPKQFRIPDQK